MTSSIWAQADPTGVTGYAYTTDAGVYGVYFTVANSGTLTEVWFYSPAASATGVGGGGVLPAAVGVYDTATQTLLTSNTSPTWSGAAGSGWVSTTITSLAVSPGNGYMAVYCLATSGNNDQAYIFSGGSWFPTTSSDSNITAPLTDYSGSDQGAYSTGSTSLVFPTSYAGSALNWLADVGITFSVGPPTGTVTMTAPAPTMAAVGGIPLTAEAHTDATPRKAVPGTFTPGYVAMVGGSPTGTATTHVPTATMSASGNVTEPPVSGTGSLAVPTPSMAAAGYGPVTGTGGLATPTPSMAATNETTYTFFQPGGAASVTPPGSATSNSGTFNAGLCFAVYGGGNWFNGFYFYCCASGQSTSPVTATLYSVSPVATTGAPQGTAIASATSGTLTAGAWNWIPLGTPVQLAPSYDKNDPAAGQTYIASVVFSGAFPDTANYWSSGGGASGLHSGPLYSYDNNANTPPLAGLQSLYSTSSGCPLDNPGNSDNLYVDVQVGTQAPPGYTGSSRLWPNTQTANGSTTGDDNVNYTIAIKTSLDGECTLDNVWYFSPAAATTLATRCDVWDISTGLSVASITSPSWKTASGSSFTATNVSGAVSGAGTWIKAAFAGGVTLGSGNYAVSVFNANGTTDANWSPKDAQTDYWGQTATDSAGAQGITCGPISAPGYSTASSGYVYDGANGGSTPPFSNGTQAHAQPVFGMNNSGTVQYPELYAVVNTDQTQNYWVDLEATPLTSTTGTGGMTASTPTMSATGTSVFSGTASMVASTPTMSATTTETFSGTISMTVPTPTILATAGSLVTGTAAMTVPTPSMTAAGTEMIAGTASMGAPAPAISATGSVANPVAGTAALTVPTVSVLGTSGILTTGSGSLGAPAPSVAAAGTLTLTGAGSLNAPAAAIAASGGETLTGAGALEATRPVIAASGTALLPITGTGSLTAPTPVPLAFASGPPPVTGAGAVAVTAPGVYILANAPTPITGAVPLAASVTLTNTLSASVSVTNTLAASASLTNELAAQIWQ